MSRKGKKPAKKGADLVVVEQPSTDGMTPKFCLHHLQRGFDVENLDQDRRAEFARRIAKLCSIPWSTIAGSGRHSWGFEWLPKKALKPQIPAKFEGEDRFCVLRYTGDKRPMVGIRASEVLHVIWIEREFGDLYDHG